MSVRGVAAIGMLLLVPPACGGEDDDATSSATSATGAQSTGAGGAGQGGSSTGSPASGTTGTGGGGGEDTTSEGAGAGVPSCSSTPLGPTELVDADDAACVEGGGNGLELVIPDGAPDYFTQLVTVGDRRAAGGPFIGGGAVLMDADGSAPTAPFAEGGVSIAGRDGVLGLATFDGSFARRSSAGVAIGEPLAIADTDALVVGADAGGWLLGWWLEGTIQAQLLDGDAAASGEPIVIDAGWSDDLLNLAPIHHGPAPAMLISGRQGTVERIALATLPDGSAPVVAQSLCSPSSLVVIAGVPVDDGWVVLFAVGDGQGAPALARLDAEGAAAGAAVRIPGFELVHSLAVSGGTVLVGGQREGRAAVRAFSADSLDPAGPPVCLGSATFLPTAVDADGNGFAVLHGDGDLAFLTRTDGVGASR